MADNSELIKRIKECQQQVVAASKVLRLAEATIRANELQEESNQPDFWNKQERAQIVSKELSKLRAKIEPWEKLERQLNDAEELNALNDESLLSEISQNVEAIEKELAERKLDLRYSGAYDDFDAIISIHAGAGGTDAQDWAEMLERMYLRWCETNKLKTTIIERSAGDEAGLKSVSYSVEGSLVFGKLKSENGVHRLVRLSPFNSDNLRQTSFAKVEVMPKIDTPDVIEVDEKDLKIDVYRSGGKGGQSVNTTDSAVRVTHIPTGIVVAIQNERSQLQNKEMAMTIVRSKLAQLQLEQHVEAVAELKGPNEQAAWGNQIRNYVLHPYKMVKDVRTGQESSDPEKVLDGDINQFIFAFLDSQPSE